MTSCVGNMSSCGEHAELGAEKHTPFQRVNEVTRHQRFPGFTSFSGSLPPMNEQVDRSRKRMGVRLGDRVLHYRQLASRRRRNHLLFYRFGDLGFEYLSCGSA